MKAAQLYLIPFAHTDLFWLGSQEECLSRGNRIISEVIRIAKKYRNFCFLFEDAVFVKHFLDTHPEKKEDLIRLLEEGRIEVGPKWAGIYQNAQSGEDLVRNTLYAKQFLREELNVDTKTVHFGDLPGFTPQFPQILCKSGVYHAIITRSGPKKIALFFWRSPDGSRILIWHAIKSYTWGLDLRLHETPNDDELEKEIKEVSSLTSGAPVLMHWGCDLTIPTERLCKNIAKWNKTREMKIRISTPTHYFEEVKSTTSLPVLSGETPRVWWPRDGRFPHIATLDIPATNALLAAEKFATVTSLLGLVKYPDIQLKETWKKLLQAMDHNYDGQGGTNGDRRKLEYHKLAIFIGEEILRNSLGRLAENVEVRHGPRCNPIVIFNSLSWIRDEIAKAHVTFHGDILPGDVAPFRNVILKDEEGNEVPFQYLDVHEGPARDVTILFYSKEVPSIGYKTFYLVPSRKASRYGKTCKICEIEEKVKKVWTRKEVVTLENNYSLVYLNKLTGTIDITDKERDRCVIREMKLQGVEEKTGNYWAAETTGRIFENGVDEVRIAENGPVRTKVVIRGRIRGSEAQQEILLYKDIPRIDLVNTIVWEGGQPLRIQQIFPIKIEAPHINYGIPYGANSFENIIPDSGPVRVDELSEDLWKCSRDIQKWIDVSNASYGVTIASDFRSVEIEESRVKFDLLWGAGSPMCRTIRGKESELLQIPPRGTYVFRFSLHTHDGTWQEFKSYRKGWQLTNPLICVSSNDPITERKLPPTKSFCSVSADNVVVTVLKKGEKDNLPVLRCYEAEGKSASIKVNLFKPLKGLVETNLLEDKVEPLHDLISQIKAYEIKTLRLEM